MATQVGIDKVDNFVFALDYSQVTFAEYVWFEVFEFLHGLTPIRDMGTERRGKRPVNILAEQDPPLWCIHPCDHGAGGMTWSMQQVQVGLWEFQCMGVGSDFFIYFGRLKGYVVPVCCSAFFIGIFYGFRVQVMGYDFAVGIIFQLGGGSHVVYVSVGDYKGVDMGWVHACL